jgi:hypothetical protein
MSKAKSKALKNMKATERMGKGGEKEEKEIERKEEKAICSRCGSKEHKTEEHK